MNETLTDYVRNFDDSTSFERFSSARDGYIVNGMEREAAELKAFKETFPILEVPRWFAYEHGK